MQPPAAAGYGTVFRTPPHRRGSARRCSSLPDLLGQSGRLHLPHPFDRWRRPLFSTAPRGVSQGYGQRADPDPWRRCRSAGHAGGSVREARADRAPGCSGPGDWAGRSAHPDDHHDDLRTDVHIPKGEYPVKPGLIVGHEPVGVIEKLGPGVTGYAVGQRFTVGASTPCGECHGCFRGGLSQCAMIHEHGFSKAHGGWRFGIAIDGCQAACVRVLAA
jgi:hypothetical protein